MPSSKPPSAPSSTTQQVVSLLLVLHLFCVLLTLASFSNSSPFQRRLLRLLAGYTRTTNLAPARAPYYLTRYDALGGANVLDDEYFLELETVSAVGEVVRHNLNESALSFPDARRRYRDLAASIAANVGEGGDESRALELAAAAASYGLKAHGAEQGVLKVRHHMSQPRDLDSLQEGFPEDPRDDRYLLTVYEADVLLDESGELQLIKREDKGQVAPVRAEAKP